MACSRTGTPKEQASFAPGPIYGLAGWTYEVTCAARTLRPRSAPLSKIPTPVLRAGSGDLTARAGVAETTIYRRWPNVSAIVTDAFLAEVTRTAPIQERTTVRESFAASMRMLARAYRGRQGKILQPLLGRAQLDEKLREAVRKALGGAPAAVRPRDHPARDQARRTPCRARSRRSPGCTLRPILSPASGSLRQRRDLRRLCRRAGRYGVRRVGAGIALSRMCTWVQDTKASCGTPSRKKARSASSPRPGAFEDRASTPGFFRQHPPQFVVFCKSLKKQLSR
jgi:AcrR family transcriptional regulator